MTELDKAVGSQGVAHDKSVGGGHVSTVKEHGHIGALTSIRFFAAAGVVEGHSWSLFPPSFLLGLKLNQGVSIFFVLSGFILAYAYPTFNDVVNRQFLIARFARIWPLHIAATIFLILLVPGTLWPSPGNGGLVSALHYFTLTHAWFPTWDNFLAYNGVSWTLSVELFFYLSFPLWILNWQGWNWLKLPLSLLPLLIIIDFANFAKLASEDWAPGITRTGLLYVFPLTRLPEFVLGVVLGGWWNKRRFTWPFLLSILAEVTAVAALLWALARVWPIAHLPETRWLLGEGGAYWLLECGFVPIFAFFIFVMASSSGLLARLFRCRAMILLGEISFAMYLFHTILLRYYQSLPPFVQQNPIGFRILYWAGVIALSFLAFELIESPMRGLITGRTVRTSFEQVRLRRLVIGVAFLVLTMAIVLPRF